MRKTKNEERIGTRVTRAALLVCVTAGLYSFFVFRFSLLRAQDPPAPRPFTTEVNYVRVDMYPTSGDMPVLDLQQSEIEVLEDGVPQKIAQFEHVSVAGLASADATRAVDAGGDAARGAGSRAPGFVLFLDPRHVDVDGSMQVRRPHDRRVEQPHRRR